jgi:DNA mismatch repair protein MSH6
LGESLRYLLANISMEMRTKQKQSAGKEIVHRELTQVFTNGTIVDGIYLTSDDPNLCVAIKVGLHMVSG